MEVTTVGGGPGGLYASLLLKDRHPDWSITVLERNPPGVTYGWGIVFPDRGLTNLAEADPETHAAITAAFTEWEPFDIHYAGDRYRCGGHRFASLMRTDLLAILQERCRAAGVELEFETEVTDPEGRAAESDLLIAADGINSRARGAFADRFGTETIEGEARFSWFGTDRPFDALSHIFVETEAGLWCAHTYPGETSTFIVDCDAETWRNAGIADMAEAEYLAYLEDAFAGYLDGHPIRSQQDRWRTFTTVTNETWFHDTVVLLGDAARTAHYSIGSGTTLALEDGIGLARAFDGFGGDLDAALADYERRRQSFAEPLQRAGERSRQHFEHIRRFYGTPGPQFALHHLTRSGRLTYGSLEARDPEFVADFDRWFAEHETPLAAEVVGDTPAPPSRQPLALREVTLPNRVVGVCEPTWSATDGRPSEAAIEAFVARAADGAGLALTQPLAVEAVGRPTPGSPGLYDDEQAGRWADAVDRARTRSAGLLGVHLRHAGPRAARDAAAFYGGGTRPREWPWRAPLHESFPEPPGAFRPREMSRSAMDRVRESFVDAASRAAAAGFDHLQLDAGGGSLLAAFRSPRTNHRQDDYGGTPTARRRYLLDVVDAVREVWPGGKPLGVTLQAADWVDGGLPLEDAIETAEALDEHGVDLVAPVAGGVPGARRPHPNADVSAYSDHLRHAAGVRTLATPHATERDTVDTLVGTGRADLCTFAGRLEG